MPLREDSRDGKAEKDTRLPKVEKRLPRVKDTFPFKRSIGYTRGGEKSLARRQQKTSTRYIRAHTQIYGNAN